MFEKFKAKQHCFIYKTQNHIIFKILQRVYKYLKFILKHLNTIILAVSCIMLQLNVHNISLVLIVNRVSKRKKKESHRITKEKIIGR